MYIKGIGIDLVELEEMRSHHTEKFVKRILSDKEQQLYNRLESNKRKLEFIAGRFAVKEAYTKAYGQFDAPLNFKDVSVLADENGKPVIQSSYRSEDLCHVSVSHSTNYIVAICQVIQTERE